MAENTANIALINTGDTNIDTSGFAEPGVELVKVVLGNFLDPIGKILAAGAQVAVYKMQERCPEAFSPVEQRGLYRIAKQAGEEQQNLEAITTLAVPLLSESAKPENISKDFRADFINKAKNVFNPEMQILWASILAGEANKPGSFSRETLHRVSILEKDDAIHFTNLCRFMFSLDGQKALYICNQTETLRIEKYGLTREVLYRLEEIDLISVADPIPGVQIPIPHHFTAIYFDKEFEMDFSHYGPNPSDTSIGYVAFRRIGRQLSDICGALPDNEISDRFENAWREFIKDKTPKAA